jgi:hypothetical protein
MKGGRIKKKRAEHEGTLSSSPLYMVGFSSLELSAQL